MHIPDSTHKETLTAIAKAADLCLCPCKHSIIDNSKVISTNLVDDGIVDLILRVESRDERGERLFHHDLEVEIFKSGTDLSITLSWINAEDRPMLWQGRHPVWMDSVTGKRCESPVDNASFEAFARRIRALFLTEESC